VKIYAFKLLLVPLFFFFTLSSAVEPQEGWAGEKDGVYSWRLMATPGGMNPDDNWYSAGSDPQGNIYVGGMDHKTNAALYVVRADDQKIHYAGDCRTASEAAGNLNSGETFQKFHVRPTWYEGKVYIASNNCSEYHSGCAKSRGFHWYSYDPATAKFVDLSAKEPDGVAVPGFQAEYLELDPQRGWIWAAITPRGHLASYSVAEGVTTDHGRPPDTPDEYVDNGGAHWVAGDGKVYFTMHGDQSFYDHVHYYDPATGTWGEKPEWKCDHLKQGHWSVDRTKYYAVDQYGTLYIYNDTDCSFTKGGEFSHPGVRFVTRSFNVHPNGRFAYSVNDNSSGSKHYLVELDLHTGECTTLSPLSALDKTVGSADARIHGGHDAWDTHGRFYFATMGNQPGYGNVIVTRIDPVALKKALGLPVTAVCRPLTINKHPNEIRCVFGPSLPYIAFRSRSHNNKNGVYQLSGRKVPIHTRRIWEK
jgi:hypothetical protein